MNDFRILYVEDDADKAAQVKAAVEDDDSAGREARFFRKMVVESVASPKYIGERLDEQYDVVLADIMFPTGPNGAEVNCLGEIIAAVRMWCREKKVFPAIPIIAYTSFEEAFRTSLQFGSELYDIWDKVLAEPKFVAWRFKRLAIELSRTRPDALLQRLVRNLHSPVSWHADVVQMTRKYNEGWTETDQIQRAGKAISNIGGRIGLQELIDSFWNAMMVWEPLIRSVADSVRGHARHVINVFWMGYVVLHNQEFRDWLVRSSGRKDPQFYSDVLTAWFLAGIFHDVAGCVEKQEKVTRAINTLMVPFPSIFRKKAVTDAADLEEAARMIADAESTISLFKGEELKRELRRHWQASLGVHEPDHGIVAALHLLRSVDGGPCRESAVMAAKAMALHNLVGKLPSGLVNWQDEPLGCLLIMCDQLQTWDRERGTSNLHDKPQPERAELGSLEFKCDGALSLSMDINYIATRKAERDSDTYKELREDLEKVLRDKPSAALRKIRQPWEPFSFDVGFSLNGEPLDVPGFNFPSSGVGEEQEPMRTTPADR